MSNTSRKTGTYTRIYDYIDSIEDNLDLLKEDIKVEDGFGAEMDIKQIRTRLEQIEEAMEEGGI